MPLNPDVIMAILTHTRFGAIWQYHLALSAALMAAVVLLPPKRRRGLGVGDWGFAGPGLLLAALLLASLAWVGHAQMATGTEATVRLANQTVHLIAAAAWLGGLAPLAWMLKQARSHPTAGPPGPVFRVLRRFSAMALTAVVLLVLSGLVNGWFLVGSVDALVSTAYGQVLMVKLVLFFGLLAIAAINRLILMPRLIAATEPRSTLTALHRAVVAEQGLGLAALGVACVLGSLAPAG